MQRVAHDRDYKVRVTKHANDEIGTLIDCFHEMLARIERHDASLTTARLEAEAASRAKSSFLATMSHELRTPLNAILGFSEIMMTETFGPLGSPNYRDYTRDIYDSGMHLLNVINDVLDLSKVEAGRLDLSRTDIDVDDTVEAALRFFRERSKKAGLTVTAEIEPGLPRSSPTNASCANASSTWSRMPSSSRRRAGASPSPCAASPTAGHR
jgi:signal transduction histidine kinase